MIGGGSEPELAIHTRLLRTDRLPSRGDIGSLGESIAAQFLVDRGAVIVDRNVMIGRGEIDIVVKLAGELIAVEVKSAASEHPIDPVFHFDDEKQRQVRSLANRRGIGRVDYVGVCIGPTGATVRWLPRAC